MNGYTQKQQEYINSVDGNAHMSAVEIIGDLEARHNALKEAVALMLAALDSDKADAMVRYFDARAEVDRLIAEGHAE